jgi:hypothetical protein
MSLYSHRPLTRRRVSLEFERLEDRTAPAVVAAPVNPQDLLTAAATISSTANAFPATTAQALAPVVTSGSGTGTPTGTVGSALAGPTQLGAPVGSTGGLPGPSTPTNALFLLASLPGGPVNAALGGSAGLLSTGAVVTNGTAGLPTGSAISVPGSAVLDGPDVLFGIQGFANRSLFPATQSVGGTALVLGQPANAFMPTEAAPPARPVETLPMPQPAASVPTPEGIVLGDESLPPDEGPSVPVPAMTAAEAPSAPAAAVAIPDLAGQADARSHQPATDPVRAASVAAAVGTLLTPPVVDRRTEDRTRREAPDGPSGYAA